MKVWKQTQKEKHNRLNDIINSNKSACLIHIQIFTLKTFGKFNSIFKILIKLNYINAYYYFNMSTPSTFIMICFKNILDD